MNDLNALMEEFFKAGGEIEEIPYGMITRRKPQLKESYLGKVKALPDKKPEIVKRILMVVAENPGIDSPGAAKIIKKATGRNIGGPELAQIAKRWGIPMGKE